MIMMVLVGHQSWGSICDENPGDYLGVCPKIILVQILTKIGWTANILEQGESGRGSDEVARPQVDRAHGKKIISP